MKIRFDSLTPVYLQIAEAIEDDIVAGRLAEGDAAYSQLTLSRELGINPATAAKGINVLVAKGILAKQRGASMVVATGAAARLLDERRAVRFRERVEALVAEARKCRLSEEEVVAAVQQHYREGMTSWEQ